MFSSVSGLKAHQTKMDVIGNNIANVNTIGFKSSRVTFKEVFSQTLQSASAPDQTTGRGGINPMQVGLGIGLSAIDTITTQGSVQRTDNVTDLSINGEGFFVVKNGNSGTYAFTRAGDFIIDKLGNLTTSSGMNVYGWMDYGGKADANGNYIFDTDKEIEPINLYTDDYNKNKRIIAAKKTSQVAFAGNLDASNNAIGTDAVTNGLPEPQFISTVIVYDSLGNDYEININFWKLEADGATADGETGTTTWYWTATVDGSGTTSAANGYLKFDGKGEIITNDSTATVTPKIRLVPDESVGTEPVDIDLDFSKLTMYAADSSVKDTYVDGYPTGTLVSFNIGSDGVITGVYSNGQQQPLGMLALAMFDNPAGLERIGNNLYVETTNSGNFRRGIKAGADGSGTISPGTLEMSNVDLSKEFTEMIITQRGFQANSRIITVSDEMLQELVNMKR